MTRFDEAEHPRGHAGKFTEKPQSESEVRLTGDAVDEVQNGFERISYHMKMGDFEGATEIEKRLRSYPPEMIVNQLIDDAKVNGALQFVRGQKPQKPAEKLPKGKVRARNGRVYVPADQYIPSDPQSMRLSFNRPLNRNEKRRVASLVGYLYRSTVAGESLSEVENDGDNAIVLYADTTKSARDDLGEALREFNEGLPKILTEGTPVRKTNRSGPNTAGTRLVEGIPGVRARLFWDEV